MQEQLPSGDPDKSAQRVERPEGGPQAERCESSRCISSLCYWIPACAGMTEYELIRPSLVYPSATRVLVTATAIIRPYPQLVDTVLPGFAVNGYCVYDRDQAVRHLASAGLFVDESGAIGMNTAAKKRTDHVNQCIISSMQQ